MATNNDLNLGVVSLPVNQGGSGIATTNAYGVICAGTTSTGNLQSLSSVGSSADVLTSNGPSALPIFQVSGGTSPVKYANVSISSSDLLGMKVTPKQLVAAGGSNTLLIVNNATIEFNGSSTAYKVGGAINIQWDSGVGGVVAAGSWSNTILLTKLVQTTSNITMNVTAGLAASTTVNKGLYLSNATASFTTGTGTATMHLYYSILSTTI